METQAERRTVYSAGIVGQDVQQSARKCQISNTLCTHSRDLDQKIDKREAVKAVSSRLKGSDLHKIVDGPHFRLLREIL